MIENKEDKLEDKLNEVFIRTESVYYIKDRLEKENQNFKNNFDYKYYTNVLNMFKEHGKPYLEDVYNCCFEYALSKKQRNKSE